MKTKAFTLIELLIVVAILAVLAAIATPIYAFVVTYALLKVIGALMPLRATEREEATGMDLVYHGEEAYPTGEGAILVHPEDMGEAPVPVKSG